MPTDTDKNPAVKLLDTYRSMLTARQQGLRHAGFQMERTLGRSPTLAIAGPITSELVQNWCEQWGSRWKPACRGLNLVVGPYFVRLFS